MRDGCIFAPLAGTNSDDHRRNGSIILAIAIKRLDLTISIGVPDGGGEYQKIILWPYNTRNGERAAMLGNISYQDVLASYKEQNYKERVTTMWYPDEEYGIWVKVPYGADLCGIHVQYVQYKATALQAACDVGWAQRSRITDEKAERANCSMQIRQLGLIHITATFNIQSWWVDLNYWVIGWSWINLQCGRHFVTLVLFANIRLAHFQILRVIFIFYRLLKPLSSSSTLLFQLFFGKRYQNIYGFFPRKISIKPKTSVFSHVTQLMSNNSSPCTTSQSLIFVTMYHPKRKVLKKGRFGPSTSRSNEFFERRVSFISPCGVSRQVCSVFRMICSCARVEYQKKMLYE